MDLKISNPQIHLSYKSGFVDLDLKPPYLDLDLTIFEKVGFGLDLSFFKRPDLDLDLKIGPDLDLNIAGFARHWYKGSVAPWAYYQLLLHLSECPLLSP